MLMLTSIEWYKWCMGTACTNGSDHTGRQEYLPKPLDPGSIQSLNPVEQKELQNFSQNTTEQKEYSA